MFRKKYFLSFHKPIGFKNEAVQFMRRLNKKWYLTHRVEDATRLNIFQVKWYYFLFIFYRNNNKKLFAYNRPVGIVKKNEFTNLYH